MEADGEKDCPAVIVEQVNSADVEQCYAAQVLVYDDQNTYLVQDVAEEQVVETELQEMAAGKHQFSQLSEGCISMQGKLCIMHLFERAISEVVSL